MSPRPETLIVPPKAIGDEIGVAAVRVSARKLYAVDKDLKILFRCYRHKDDNLEQDFVALVKMMAERATNSKIAIIEKV